MPRLICAIDCQDTALEIPAQPLIGRQSEGVRAEDRPDV
jgi:hypothetical protein